METDGLDVELLTRALKNLAVLHAVVFDDRRRSPGVERKDNEGFSVFSAGVAWGCHVFQSVLQAIAEADCGPQTLVIRNQLYESEDEDIREFFDEGIPIWTFNDLDLLIPVHKMALLTKNLRILILNDLRTEDRDAVINNPAYRYLTQPGSIGQFVESAPQLELLNIRFFKLEYPTSGGIRTECLTGAAQLPRLNTLIIGGLSIEATELAIGYSNSLNHSSTSGFIVWI